jgi:hypothetical protein
VEAEYGKTSPELFQGLLNLVATQLERGELPEAEQSIQKLRARLAQLSPPTPQVLLAIHQAEATLLRHRGKLDQARALLESALDMDGITQDMFVEERISLLNNLGGVIEAQGSLTQAIPYYEQAQQLLPQVSNLPLGHELELTLLANLAGNLFKQGSKEKSAELYNRVEVLLNKSGGKEHPRHILIMQQRGAQALAQQQWVLARQLLTQTLDRAKESLASEHPLLGLVYRQLGKATEESAALEEAAEYYAKALSHDERTYGQDAPQLRAVLQALEELATKRGDRALAVKMAERAAHIGRKQ